MKPFQTILFAADFSQNAKDAFGAACSLATPGETRLHVLHVVEPNLVPEEPTFFGQATVQFYDALKDGRSDETLKRSMSEVYAPDRPVDVEYHTSHGDASTEILHMADEIGVDLIVLGTRGRTGLGWLLTGSVATSVLRRSRCPVMAFHSRERPHKIAEKPVLLHPTDFSESSAEASKVARSLARDLGARLIIVHVAPFDVLLNDMVVPVDARLYRDALEEQRRRADGPDLKYPAESRLSRGDAGEEIIRTAREVGCSLIVMGSHGRTGLGRLLVGSVAEYVMPRADCPVLIVKSPRHLPSPAAERTAAPAVTVY